MTNSPTNRKWAGRRWVSQTHCLFSMKQESESRQCSEFLANKNINNQFSRKCRMGLLPIECDEVEVFRWSPPSSQLGLAFALIGAPSLMDVIFFQSHLLSSSAQHCMASISLNNHGGPVDSGTGYSLFSISHFHRHSGSTSVWVSLGTYAHVRTEANTRSYCLTQECPSTRLN